MFQKPNCKQITSSLNAIRNKKALFETELEEGNIQSCLEAKTDLLEMIKKLEVELWPFEQEELSIERLKTTYEQYKTLFESNGIVKEGKISPEFLSNELKDETFTMPTEEQFLEYISSKEVEVKAMVELDLVEPILVPIAANFGGFAEVDGYWTYSGLLDILAKSIHMLGMENLLKDSDGALLPTKLAWGNVSYSSSDINCPVYIDNMFKNMLYSFKNKDGTFSENLTQKEYIKKHRDVASLFPGFAIYFKEKGNLLPCDRDERDPLKEMTADRQYQQHKEGLHKLGLTGSTAHTELIILLASLQKKGQVTRDWNNRNDAAGFLGGNTFQDSTKLGHFSWNRDPGRFYLGVSNPNHSDSRVAGVPLGELI